MAITLLTVANDHTCEKCGQTIKAGERAVKTKAARLSCSATEFGSVFLHEACWKPEGGKHGRT